jgi:hypothetical protein
MLPQWWKERQSGFPSSDYTNATDKEEVLWQVGKLHRDFAVFVQLLLIHFKQSVQVFHAGRN